MKNPLDVMREKRTVKMGTARLINTLKVFRTKIENGTLDMEDFCKEQGLDYVEISGVILNGLDIYSGVLDLLSELSQYEEKKRQKNKDLTVKLVTE